MTADGDMTENHILPPEWLNKDYLENACREGMKLPNLKVTSCHIKPAVAPGANYATLVFRGTLNITKTTDSSPETISVIMKTDPLGKAAEYMNDFGLFGNESKMLMEIMPTVTKLLKSVDPTQEPLSATCFYYSNKPGNLMLLDDLSVYGFANADRMNGLDMNHTKLVLESLAKYHAATLSILQKTPEKLEQFRESAWDEKNREMIAPMINSSVNGLIEEVESWDDFPQEYLEKIRNLKYTCLEKNFEVWHESKDELNVLQHGDCWINNFMFSKEEEQVKGFRFVDFQLPTIRPPSLDLNYFIFTSPSIEHRLTKLDEMLSTYYNTFITTVEKLNITLPCKYSFEDLKASFMRKLFFGFIATIIVYPITIQPPADAPDVNDFFEEEKSKRSLYQVPRFRKAFTALMPFFVKEGAL